MLAGSDGLCVGCRGPVVEVHLRPISTLGALLGELFLAEAALVAAAPDADHPDEQHKDDDEEHGSSDASSDVGKLRLFLTVLAIEGAGTKAVRIVVLLVLSAGAVVETEILAVVNTRLIQGAVALEAFLAATSVSVGPVLFLLEQAVSVPVAELGLRARVGALVPPRGADVVGDADVVSAGVLRALSALGLLVLGLVLADGARLALVVRGVEVLPGDTYGQAAVSLGGGAGAEGGAAWLAVLAAAVQAAGAVAPLGTHLALAVHAELLTVLAIRPTLVPRSRLLSPGGQAHAAQVAGKLALAGLEPAVAAGPAQLGHLVVVVPGLAAFLALGGAGGALGLGDSLQVLDHGTLVAGQTRRILVVLSDGALGALGSSGQVKVCPGRARDALVVDHHLAGVASEAFLEDDGAWVEECAGQGVHLLVLRERRV